MKQGLLCLSVVLAGCCPLFSGEASDDPPAVNVPVVPPTGPTAVSCPAIQDMILGTWTTEGFIEEYRPGNVYVLNGVEGTIRWLGPGRAFLDVGTLHAEYYLALTGPNELIAINPDHVGTSYRRTSPPPAVDASCFDFSQQLVGTWVGGTYTETYQAGGGYQVNNLTGTWQLTGPGHLRVSTQTGTGDYLVAVLSPTSMVAVSQTSNRGTIYTRQ